MSTMQAFMTRFLRAPALSKVAIPTPRPNELLIKVAFVSLNPTDFKHAAVALPPSKIIGCDFSGTITSLGQDVDRTSFALGDRVAGIVHGCQYSHTGAFAEYVVTDAEVCFKVPPEIALEAACTLGVGWVSAVQALAQRLYLDEGGLEGKDDDDDTLLIYSAATGMGICTIQQTRLEHPSTFIIALASPQHHEMLRRLGAHEVFDYRSDSVVEDVRALGRDIRRAVDCFSEGTSTTLAARCMLPHDNEGKDMTKTRRIVRTLPPSMIKGFLPASIRANEWIVSYTALGKPFWFIFKHYPAAPQDYEIASAYLKRLTTLLQEGKVVPISHTLMPGGLADIGAGFAELKGGKVKGKRLVYKVGGDVVT